MSLSGTDLQQTAAPTARRRRVQRDERPPRRIPRGRAAAGLVALLEVVLLAWLVLAPALPVRAVQVNGLEHLTRGQVVATAGLNRPLSMAAVDGDSIRRKLERLPWVRTASAQPLLPDRVVIDVQEWTPVALYEPASGGHGFLLNDQAAVLAPGEPDPGLVVVQGPQPATRPGDHPIDAQLLTALVRIQAAFPTLYPGQKVASFQLDCMGGLTLTTDKGVKVVFGRVLTPDQFAALQAKVSALKSVASDGEVQHGQVDYINVENPNQVAVHFKGDKPPASPSPAPPAKGGASPAPAPVLIGCR